MDQVKKGTIIRDTDQLQSTMDQTNNADTEEDECCGGGVGSGESSSAEKEKKKKGPAAATPGRSSRGGSSGGGGGGGGSMVSPPCCQAERCGADLSDAKRYHRRHRVCELHSKAPVVPVAGLRQRFCQQCSRFHELSEFDEAKRSCRRRLAGHNERRRKSSVESCCGEGSATRITSKETQYNTGDGNDQRAKFQMTLPGNSQYNKHYPVR